ncbi:MAG: zinc-dependent metalloprotease [Actinomycetota bacterium]|nr:zinc-dependent metalloprotease [Actinomycetota bacterium]
MADLIDARIARLVARRFTGDGSVADSYLVETLRRDLATAVPKAEELVAKESGIPRPDPVNWAIVDRGSWVEANISGMVRLLSPLEKSLRPRLEGLAVPVRVAQRTAISTEVGVLLGYVSRRVLGQYDVLVTETPSPPAPTRRTRRKALSNGTNLYFVGQNIVETERKFGFVPRDFSLWVAVHEVTHRFQFAGVPWLSGHFLKLVESYLGSLELDAGGLAARLASAARRLLAGDVPPEERNPIYLLSSEEQKRTLDELQALMSVVEGHGNYVMDAIGSQIIPSFPRMRRVFERRRQQVTALQRIINHAIGLEMKLKQYELGQSFCNHVVEKKGPAALAGLWTSPSSFPTMAELRDPDRWIGRVA